MENPFRRLHPGNFARTSGALVVLFACIVGVTLARHEMWLDELSPWDIARDARTLPGLFANMHYEPHPALWYLILYAASRLTTDPRAMQVAHWLIATGSVALLAWKSPFSRLETWLLAFSYLFVFEYAVLSRNYASGVLLAFAVCAAYASTRPSVPLLTVLLALLANTSAFGVALTVALAAGILIDGRIRRGPAFAAGAVVVTAATVVSVLTIRLAPDNMFGRVFHLMPSTSRLAYALDAFWAAYVPLPDFRAASPWNSNILLGGWIPSGRRPQTLPALLALVPMIAALVALRRSRGALAAYLVGLCSMLTLIFVTYSGGSRHHGHLFVLFVVCLWIARIGKETTEAVGTDSSADDRRRQRHWPLLVMFLVPQVVAGAFFVVADLRGPFSVQKDLAAFVARLPRSSMVVVAESGPLSYVGPPLSAYLRKPVYYVLGERVVRGSFLVCDAEHYRGATQDQVATQVRHLATRLNTDVYIVTNNWEPSGLGEHIAHFDRHLEIDERSADVYLVRHSDVEP